ncbi:Williams Beuren syndrome chromosomal region 16 [Trichuris trichiura]|uniref:Williams Beuren syndrome chromosomal region 16 n=1 Tax=Trichuris trichiura TaxID=36087 RepID=A0A077Z6Z2_TRITR|nr:Williams Beuren syndrome chromosomal region 16 [Trichuris trichiura]
MHGTDEQNLFCVTRSEVQTLPDVYSVQQRHFEYADLVGKMHAMMRSSKPASTFSVYIGVFMATVSSRLLRVSKLFLRTARASTSKHEWESEEMPIFEYVPEKGKHRRKVRLYGWGYAATGELGIKEFLRPTYHESPLEFTHKPCIIPFGDNHPVSSIACGVGYSVFVAKGSKNRLPTAYGTGVNAYHQLGFHPHNISPEQGIQYLIEPREIPLPLRFPDSTRVTHVACGKAHTVIATDKEGVYSLGGNQYGQCGRSIIENEDYTRCSISHKIDGLPSDVTQVVCGMDHTIIVDANGKVYTFGCAMDGQLGYKSSWSNWQPKVVEGDIKNEKIVQVSCGADSVLALSDKGEVFCWGNSEYRQFGSVTTDMQVFEPRHLNLKIGPVRQVASGGSSCAVLTESGQIYAWGYGPLGLGPEQLFKGSRTLLPPPLFGANEFRDNIYPERLFAGLMHYAVINSKGELYMWGRNEFGNLGLGHARYQYFPFKVITANLNCVSNFRSFKVSVNCDVRQVAIGPCHTLARCQTWL